MLDEDWYDFGCALAEAFPEARYYLRPDDINTPKEMWTTPEPPILTLRKHLSDLERGDWMVAHEPVMVFDPRWQPRWKKYYYPAEAAVPEEWWWILIPPPHPSVRFRLGGYIREQPVPHPDLGDLEFYATPKNKEHLALAARVFRLFAKFATNKKGLVRVRVPSLEVTVPLENRGSPFWCGHHAIEWAREDPRRVLFYTPVGFGTRPTGEVVPLARKAPSARKPARARK